MALVVTANGAQDFDMGSVIETRDRFTTGLILPPPDIKGVYHASYWWSQSLNSGFTAAIDKTADFVAHSANPVQFEEKIRESKRTEARFSFLNPSDPYHAYYRHKMDRIAQGDTGEAEAAAAKEKEEKDALERAKAVPAADIGIEPPEPEFILDMPNTSAVDM